ncbi:MAG: hypothetical protein PHC30_10565, partial [Lentisphaeria bacterium]|nr:hypothetical protein [Lentisphaeria bacterium]
LLDMAPAARVILDAPPAQTTAWVRELLHRKRPFAFSPLTDDQRDGLLRLAEAARKRRLPIVLLGSWRCLPTVMAIRELVVGGVLGKLVVLELAAPPLDSAADTTAAADLFDFLNPAARPLDTRLTAHQEAGRMTITIRGTAGLVTATGAMDGSHAVMTTEFGGHTRTTRLRPCHPGSTEIRLFLAAPPAAGCLMTILAAGMTPPKST